MRRLVLPPGANRYNKAQAISLSPSLNPPISPTKSKTLYMALELFNTDLSKLMPNIKIVLGFVEAIIFSLVYNEKIVSSSEPNHPGSKNKSSDSIIYL